jgi:hypothetical protein
LNRLQHLKLDDVVGLNATYFVKSSPTKILVHGYEDTGDTDWILNVRSAYLDSGSMSFFVANTF